MRRKLLVAAVALLAVGTVTAGALGAGGFVNDASPPNDAEEPSATPTPAPENSTIAFDGGTPVELEADGNATVSGTTELEAGTELSVRVQSADDTAPRFFKVAEATVDEDGTFAATFDLSAITSERDVNVSVRAPDTTREVTGRVVAPEGGFTEPTPTAADAPVSFDGTELVAAENATLSGMTDAESGTEISVTLQSADDGTGFYTVASATVGEDGTFTVEFDMSNVYEQRAIEITVDGEDWSHSTDGAVVAPAGGFPDVDDVEASFDGSAPIDFDASANQTVSGSTNLDAGTEVHVSVMADDDGRLLARNTTTVDDDGNFTSSLDLSNVEDDRDVTVELVVYHETVATADGRAVEESA
jgi:hypothetical protein